MLEVRPIAPEQTHALRQAVLRPHQSVHEMTYDGDAMPDAAHFGLFDGGRHVGIASVTPEPQPGVEGKGQWRVRGMAVLPETRGTGGGRCLLEACVRHVQEVGGRIIWCNARSSACGLYERNGFTTVGDPFDLPGIGEHYVMQRLV